LKKDIYSNDNNNFVVLGIMLLNVDSDGILNHCDYSFLTNFDGYFDHCKCVYYVVHYEVDHRLNIFFVPINDNLLFVKYCTSVKMLNYIYIYIISL
jgi:hypothetical protein